MISTTDAGDVAKWTLDLADWATCTDGVPGWELWDLLGEEIVTGDRTASGGASVRSKPEVSRPQRNEMSYPGTSGTQARTIRRCVE